MNKLIYLIPLLFLFGCNVDDSSTPLPISNEKKMNKKILAEVPEKKTEPPRFVYTPYYLNDFGGKLNIITDTKTSNEWIMLGNTFLTDSNKFPK